jgi:translation initiation factor IF-1
MNITVKYAGQSINVNIAEGSTVATLLSNANYQAVLGFSAKDKAVINGVTQAAAAPLGEGDVVSIENAKQDKAAGTVTLKYAGQSITVNLPDGSTVGSILGNANYQAVLGFSAKDKAVINGVTQNDAAPIGDGDVVSIENAKQDKASSVFEQMEANAKTLIGEVVTFFCSNFIDLTMGYARLEDASVILDTGTHEDPKWLNSNKYTHPIYVNISRACEMFTIVANKSV